MIPRVPSLLALFLPLRCLFGSLSYAQRKGEEVCSLLATVATSCCPRPWNHCSLCVDAGVLSSQESSWRRRSQAWLQPPCHTLAAVGSEF